MMRLRFRHVLLAACLIALSSTCLESLHAAKPGTGGTTSHPVRYKLNYFAPPFGATNFNAVWAMNESGAMVGDCYTAGLADSWSGFLYDPGLNPNQAFNLNEIVQVPEGWWIRYAYGINDRGAVVAAIVKLAAPSPDIAGYEIHGIVIDRREPTVDGKWVPHSIPDINPAFTFGREINNNGDLVGVFDQGQFGQGYQLGAFVYNTGLYRVEGADLAPTVLPVNVSWTSVHLNDPAPGRPLQVAGRSFENLAFRYTVQTEALELFPELSIYDTPEVQAVNGIGEFCGGMRVKKSKGTQTVWRPFRFDPERQPTPTLLGNETDQAGLSGEDINNTGDVITKTGYSTRGYLFHTTAGTLKVDNLVTGTADEVNRWTTSTWGNSYVTERVSLGSNSPGFPVIGTANSEVGAVLVPVLP
jgi:hypothetical protein